MFCIHIIIFLKKGGVPFLDLFLLYSINGKTLFGLIVDLNETDAFVEVCDGMIINTSINNLPKHSSVGDKVKLPSSSKDILYNNSNLI